MKKNLFFSEKNNILENAEIKDNEDSDGYFKTK